MGTERQHALERAEVSEAQVPVNVRPTHTHPVQLSSRSRGPSAVPKRDVNNAQGVGDGRAGEAPAVLGAEHRDGLAAARAAVADELGLVEHDAEPLDLRERPAVCDMSISYG